MLQNEENIAQQISKFCILHVLSAEFIRLKSEICRAIYIFRIFTTFRDQTLQFY